ncbi:MAG: glycosyltransferase family 4 protein [Fimbriimonas ginsengisoli]|uniref:Glycosyltransferase family 4 protein n=1 Tax=Fimbriimonas ginsengisoli TaxID=1005039 RepID=A0A931PUF3_FIMGI|nr:glycosyltransferase family 4 protein [Fimbriimonas ginsengisoli]
MRVMMLSWEYPPRIVGGISPHVHDLSEQLAALGVEVHVVTKSTPSAPDEEIERSGVHVHRVHLDAAPSDFMHEIQLLNAATERRVRRLLEDWRPGGQPTIFHAHDWLSLDSARELKYEYSLPLVATIHATEEGRHGGIHGETSQAIHELEYWLTYEAWRVIVCSDFMKGEIERSFDAPADKIDVIFNGVNAAKFQFDWSDEERTEERALVARPDEKIVLYVGRFVREKGIQVLLNAAGVVISRRPNTKFVVVGGGHRQHFERFTKWAHLEDKVLFTGFMANRSLHQLYRAADLAVFPSLYEPFGIVALEAMAAGLPVVASDAGGLREVVLHDSTGTLSFANNAESLAWAILRVLDDPTRAHRLAEAAGKRLRKDFDWRRLAQQTVSVYERVWSEFLASFWAQRTLWPVTPGAEQRAQERHVREKAEAGLATPRPRPAVSLTPPAESVQEGEEEPV